MRCYVFLTGLKWKFEVAMAKVNILITSNKWEWIPLRKLTMVLLQRKHEQKKTWLLHFYNKTMVNFRKGSSCYK